MILKHDVDPLRKKRTFTFLYVDDEFKLLDNKLKHLASIKMTSTPTVSVTWSGLRNQWTADACLVNRFAINKQLWLRNEVECYNVDEANDEARLIPRSVMLDTGRW